MKTNTSSFGDKNLGLWTSWYHTLYKDYSPSRGFSYGWTAFLFAPFGLYLYCLVCFYPLLHRHNTHTLTFTLSRTKQQVEGNRRKALKNLSDTFTNSVSYLTDAQRAQQLRYFRLFIGYIYMVDTFSAVTVRRVTHGTIRRFSKIYFSTIIIPYSILILNAVFQTWVHTSLPSCISADWRFELGLCCLVLRVIVSAPRRQEPHGKHSVTCEILFMFHFFLFRWGLFFAFS